MKLIEFTVLVALFSSPTCMAMAVDWDEEAKLLEARAILGYDDVYYGGYSDDKSCYDLENLTAEEWNSRGVSLTHVGESVEALECFNTAILLDPDYAWAWNNKGVALHLFMLSSSEYAYIGTPTAIDASNVILAYDEALRLDPELAEAWYNKGQLYYGKGEYWSAILCYDRAIGIYPGWGAAWQNKANAYMELDNYGMVSLKYSSIAKEFDPLVKESAKMLYLLS